MIDVRLTAPNLEVDALAQAAGGLNRHLRVVPAGHEDAAPLFVTPKKMPAPFVVHPKLGAVVSLWGSAKLSKYAGIGNEDYVALVSLLGLTQWRALQINPLLRIEDFQHPAGVRCLFAAKENPFDFALMLDPPALCGGCTGFYHCLGADAELLALRHVIAKICEAQTLAYARCASASRN